MDLASIPKDTDKYNEGKKIYDFGNIKKHSFRASTSLSFGCF